ncbi:NAD-dependent protein deacetylase of SIR2 family [hydrothermal vent metagenome]|uniref:NAD-dependent protein deacetylase of SIR2 family n=1 Tax=hydrothermal vent metagenome TaxID=652676 RepID=A0A3B1AYM3_9ZZZZ
MAKPNIDNKKILVFTGAGISAESGLQTFRDSGGLWEGCDVMEVASPGGWAKDPGHVLAFYNSRRTEAALARPNAAHLAVATLEKKYEVMVVTQNVDDLHERAGSTRVIHVHGQLNLARSCVDETLIYPIGDKPIHLGDVCEKGSQLRPHIVWFGEKIHNYDMARDFICQASRVLAVGTSLSVYPIAGLLKKARGRAEKIVLAPDIEKKPYGFDWLRGNATHLVPIITERWLSGLRVDQLK